MSITLFSLRRLHVCGGFGRSHRHLERGSRTAFRDSTRHRRLQLLDEPFFACSAVLLTFGAAAASDGLMAAHLSVIGALSTTQHSHSARRLIPLHQITESPLSIPDCRYTKSCEHSSVGIHVSQCVRVPAVTRTRTRSGRLRQSGVR